MGSLQFTDQALWGVYSLQFTGQVGTRLGMINKIVINQGDFILNDSKIMINQGGFWVNLHFCNRYCCCCYRCYFGFDFFSIFTDSLAAMWPNENSLALATLGMCVRAQFLQ